MTNPTNPSSDPVDAELDEIFEWLLALYVDTSNPYMVEEMEDDRPLFKAKINRLLMEARLKELKYLLEDFGVEDNVEPITKRINQLNEEGEK